MKYILYWEIDPVRFDAAIEKLRRVVPDESGRYPKKLSESFSIGGQFKGFRLVEASPEQQTNLMVSVMPEMLVKFVPIIEFPKIVKTYAEERNRSQT